MNIGDTAKLNTNPEDSPETEVFQGQFHQIGRAHV